MPDLSNKAAHRYWFEYTDPMIYKVVTFMEGVEEWTFDGEKSVEDAMKKLGMALENVGRVPLKNEDDFIQLLAFIRSARSLRLLQYLDSVNPGAASKLIGYAEQKSKSKEKDPATELFLRKNAIFERLRLLGRVFSQKRLSMVLKALEEHHHD